MTGIKEINTRVYVDAEGYERLRFEVVLDIPDRWTGRPNWVFAEETILVHRTPISPVRVMDWLSDLVDRVNRHMKAYAEHAAAPDVREFLGGPA